MLRSIDILFRFDDEHDLYTCCIDESGIMLQSGILALSWDILFVLKVMLDIRCVGSNDSLHLLLMSIRLYGFGE